MPKFIIQREYLLPVYQYEADTFEEARAEAAGPGHDWYNAEEDYDGSLPTTITNAKMVPEGATTDHYLIEGGPASTEWRTPARKPRFSTCSGPVCVRHGLSAGGRWIRTISPATEKLSVRARHWLPRGSATSERLRIPSGKKFESGFLQQRLRVSHRSGRRRWGTGFSSGCAPVENAIRLSDKRLGVRPAG